MEIKMMSNQDLRKLARDDETRFGRALYEYFSEDAFMNRECRKVASKFIAIVSNFAMGLDIKKVVEEFESLDKEAEETYVELGRFFPLSQKFLVSVRCEITKYLNTLESFVA